MGKNELKSRIMKRVQIIWFSKKIAPALFLYTPFLLFVAIREVAREFFVLRILDNFLYTMHAGGFSGMSRFVFSAILNIPVFPTLIILSCVGLSGWIILRLAKNFKQLRLAKSTA